MDSPIINTPVDTSARSYDLRWWLALFFVVLGIVAWSATFMIQVSRLLGENIDIVRAAYFLQDPTLASLLLAPITLMLFTLPLFLWPSRYRPALQFYGFLLLVLIAQSVLFLLFLILGSSGGDSGWAIVGLVSLPLKILLDFIPYLLAGLLLVTLRKKLSPPKSVLNIIIVIAITVSIYGYYKQISLTAVQTDPEWAKIEAYSRHIFNSGTVPSYEEYIKEPREVSAYISHFSKQEWKQYCEKFPKQFGAAGWSDKNNFNICNAVGGVHFSDSSSCKDLPVSDGGAKPQARCIMAVAISARNIDLCNGFPDSGGCRFWFQEFPKQQQAMNEAKKIDEHCRQVTRPQTQYTRDPNEKIYTDLQDALKNPDQVKILSIHGQLSVIPPEVEKLKNLQELDVSNNYLKVLPLEIGGLENLRVLDVENNQLKELPKFPKLCLLEHARIRGNLMDIGEVTNIAGHLEFMNRKVEILYHPQQGWAPR